MADVWDAGTWDGAAREQRLRWSSSTPEQRLAWLRRMQQLANQGGALTRARDQKHREQEKQWKSAKQ